MMRTPDFLSRKTMTKDRTTLKEPTTTKPAIDRCASDTVEGVFLSELCDALAKNGYRIRAITLAHNWAAFRLAVNVAKSWLPDDIQQNISRRA